MTSNKKYEIIRVAQENQHMLKRIQERSSCYNVNKWERDYQMNQYYKRNHCMFPSIDFHKTLRPGISVPLFPYKRKYATYNDHFNYDVNRRKESTNDESEDDKDKPKVLYKTNTYFHGLEQVEVEFSVQTQK